MNEDKDTLPFGIAVERIDINAETSAPKPDFNAVPILPTRNLVLFPGVTTSIALKRESAEAIATAAADKRMLIGIVCQIDPEEDNPSIENGLYPNGVMAEVIKVLSLPDGDKTALIRALGPFLITGKSRKRKNCISPLMATAQELMEIVPDEGDETLAPLMAKIREMVKNMASFLTDGLDFVLPRLLDDDDEVMIINNLATNLNFSVADKQKMLAVRTIIDRAKLLLQLLIEKEHEYEIMNDIMAQVKSDFDEDRRTAFLRHQMELIQNQLFGDTPDDIIRLLEKQEAAKMPEHADVVFKRELAKLRQINPTTPDYFVALNYLDTLTDLPWNKQTPHNSDFAAAKQTLENDHFGLKKVKERILEQMAVVMRKPDGKAPILCLVGPPGVGKTSLGKSVADAMCRQYQRVSLGGLHDEAEIRGHRRTYVGAMPGRIIDALKRAGVNNPVLVLDEIDKVGADYKGDPAAALLEVLDPEQNHRFHDNYIDLDFDLSHVLFMATANSASTIPKPLLDRMEIIDISGYLAEEKMEIARRHLIPRVFEQIGIEKSELRISNEAIREIIDRYTAESGVRQLEKKLATIARKYALAQATGEKFPKMVLSKHLKDLLGLAPILKDKYEGNDFAGVACGLAWTEVGGEIIMAEATLTKGKGELSLTGNLGQVMKESASIAFRWVKAHASQLAIDSALFEKYDLHVHFPEGAVPKDGPSAGITIATAIVSAFTQKRVAFGLAMTGEITLRGKVLPVGGIKEKMLAAKRAGITDIVLSAENRRDIEDIDKQYIAGLNFHYVNSVMDVMRIAITDTPAVDPLTL